MFRNSVTIRISLTLASITICAMLLALAIGMFPDRVGAIADGRKSLCEALGVSASIAVLRGDPAEIDLLLESAVARNADVLSAALRRSNGRLYATVGEHEQHWPNQPLDRATLTHMFVPIYRGEATWGQLELCFAESADQSWLLLPTAPIRLALVVVLVSLVGHIFYLGRVLRHLDPSRVIPGRVKKTLDSLAEGLLVLDEQERIVLANEAFAQTVGKRAEELQGHKASDLPWELEPEGHERSPWARSIHDEATATDVLKLGRESGSQRVLQVTSAPIIDEEGVNRGALASFSDVTNLEVRNAQLVDTLSRLKESRDQISARNEQLRQLAMTDPLTECLNRRAFFDEVDSHLTQAASKGLDLSYVILDIDHFKLVNDNHGHKVGDLVLQGTSRLIRETIDNVGVVCRYGGEEFSILLPGVDIEGAAEIAEVLRSRIAATAIAELEVTASFGVTQLDVEAEQPLEALEAADKALYFSKRSGRNCVTRADEVPQEMEFRAEGRARDSEERSKSEPASKHIPFTAVSVLLSTLDFRDPETAQHSRRVADLCFAMAAGRMSEEERYVLEVAALLHDLGKLSVPDAILRKPGPLTEEEWKTMDTHLRLGEKTVRNAFASNALIEILRTYRATFMGSSHAPDLPAGSQIPLPARILSVADAYDAMVSPRSYRAKMTQAEAFEELRNCAGTQFDPEVVARCIEVLSNEGAAAAKVNAPSSNAAVRVGSQLETLACAMDSEDMATMRQTVRRIKSIADDEDIDVIFDLAEEIEDAIEDDAAWTDVLRQCLELLELCRQTQSTVADATD